MRINLKIWTVCIIFLMDFKMGFAQYDPDNSVIPLSPSAMSLVKNVNIPVNPYSGTADISIPLFNLHESGITSSVDILPLLEKQVK